MEIEQYLSKQIQGFEIFKLAILGGGRGEGAVRAGAGLARKAIRGFL